ncbi:hypothetical protein BJ322DRAFT_530970 [Thelephora terrestris]|uniref:Uncharacterized protein n=1 Tax=Thelephora terrestris TaxID=56493 RepID=A0A9P6HKD0_9AGAM|nr:hypothetical protein BJ322DRAFT_530970 [Thelephora terrestris]
MEGTPQPPWSIYKEQLDFLFLGHALWEPAPTSNYTRITIGDVGFIRRGQFHLLFSAAPPLGERERGVDVPATFEQLNVGNLASTQPRQPGCLRTSTVREVEADFGATASITRPLAPGASFSYELTENRGAALVTKYRTYRVDALFESAFKKYTKRHYKSWVAFARDRQYGEDVQPVLVSGFDMTKDFAMVAYSDDRPSSGANFTITVSSLGSASNSIWGTWRTACSPHTNCGPDENDPLLRERAIESPSPHSVQAGTIPNGFDQCAFVRYFTMRLRKRFALFPKVIRAGAGPHDLSPGNNGGGTFPESTVALDDDFATSGDDLKGQWCTSTGADDSKPDIVVHNAEYVRFLPHSPFIN